MMKIMLMISIAAVVVILLRSFNMTGTYASGGDAWSRIRNGALVIDVRTPEEFAKGHLDGALNIPYDRISERAAELGTDKNRDIVLYCRSGRRSGIAQKTLEQMGFTSLLNAGGYDDLKTAGTAGH